jgi:hypothetical protein
VYGRKLRAKPAPRPWLALTINRSACSCSPTQRAIFAEKGIDRMTSADLVDALVALEGHPWAEWKAGKAITATGMARLLKPFGISPVERAYQLFQFDDAFQRYLPKSGN